MFLSKQTVVVVYAQCNLELVAWGKGIKNKVLVKQQKNDNTRG